MGHPKQRKRAACCGCIRPHCTAIDSTNSTSAIAEVGQGGTRVLSLYFAIYRSSMTNSDTYL